MKIPTPSVWLAALAVATLLLSTGCSRQKSPAASKSVSPEASVPPPVLIAPNAGIDKVLKGMNRQQVESALGKPEKINGKWWFYQHRGMIVAFGDNGVMFNIKCVSPFAGVTQQGLGLGSTRAELIAAYGNPGQDQHFEHGEENLWFAPLGISFYLEQDKVTSFIVHLDVK